MKFVMFSPMTTSSAIGRVNLLVLEALHAQGHEAVVVRTELEPWIATPHHPCPVSVLRWDDGEAVAAVIRDADQLVYQIGDNHPFHHGAVHWLGIAPGTVCLHDFFVANLFYDWFRGRRAEAEAVLARWYGPAAATDFFVASSAQELFEKAARLYPMTEWIGSMAQGVISHSHWGMERVARSCAGPTRVAALPYDAPGAPDILHSSLGASTRKAPGSVVKLLTVGHANANKRIDSVIRAISANPDLRARASYRVCGAIDPVYALSLAALARSLQVELQISGPTDDVALQQAINDADLLCCLRWPSLEAASASTAEAMLYGKAAIVTDTRFYSELPQDCVRKISPEREVAELGAAIAYLCEHPGERQAMGERARVWAEAHFRADTYAQQLVELARRGSMASARVSMARGFVAQLEAWGATPRLLDACELEKALALFDDSAAASPSSPPTNPARPVSPRAGPSPERAAPDGAIPMIPLFSASAANAGLDLGAVLQRVVDSHWFVLGQEVTAFEKEFAAYIGSPECVSVANGTDALELGLRALGVVRGDRVACVANAGFYGSTAIHTIGAQPVYVDIDAASANMAADSLMQALALKPKAVIVTHLYGRMAEIESLAAMAQAAGVAVVEDCAQSHGARRGGKLTGSVGDIGCFSFYPTKNLGALGDGGAVTCRDAEVAARLRTLRQYGWSSKYAVSTPHGRNSRLDELQAAVLRAKLPLLDGWNEARRRIAARYHVGLASLPLDLPGPIGEDYVAHLYVLRLRDPAQRAPLRAHLQTQGVATDVHYPIPDHRQTAYAVPLGGPSLAATEAACDRALTLPCFPGMDDAQVTQVIAAVASFFAR